MRRPIAIAAGLALLTSCFALPSFGQDQQRRDREAVAGVIAGAAILLGAAALAHHHHNHRDGNHLSDAEAEAEYERGYKDGLHGAAYDTDAPAEAYGPGYDAGVQERSHHVAHNRPHEWAPDRHAAPRLALRGCIGEASAFWGISPRDISAVKSGPGGSQASKSFMVEVAAGYRHGICDMKPDGTISVQFVDDARL